MKNKILFSGLILLLGITLAGIANAENQFCCEKTLDGHFCISANESQCDSSFSKAPTSCDATAYCKTGTCIDPWEGTCQEDTPKSVCNGEWTETPADQLPQCQKACCLIGDQSIFTTQTRCKKLASVYGMESTFRSDIKSEVQCIQTANPQEKGACVIQTGFDRNCRMTTRDECMNISIASGTTTETGGFFSNIFGNTNTETSSNENRVEFYSGYLCSAESLNTTCGPSQKTTCVEGQDNVYFVDTCGNLANVYDSSKINDKAYWTKITDATCGDGNGNKGSRSCGVCDYDLGSTCKTYKNTQDKNSPTYGDNLCRDLSCTYNGKTYQHGESWCETNSKSTDSPGTRYFRMVCMNSEVTVEPCDDFRNEVCIESPVKDNNTGQTFLYAGCVMNKWRDCVVQTTKDDCLNLDNRDCQWADGKRFAGITTGDQGVCLPLYAPGFDFWNSETDAEQICSAANDKITVKFEKSKLFESVWNCKENCEYCFNDKTHEDCLGGIGWIRNVQVCESLGDCGSKVNYAGTRGYGNYSVTVDSTKMLIDNLIKGK